MNSLKNYFNTINFRIKLTLIFAFIFGATTLVFNLFVFTYVIDALKNDFDDALFNYCVDISDSIEERILKGQYEVSPLQVEHGKILPFSLGTSLVILRHRDSRVLTHSGNLGDFTPPFETEVAKIDQGADAAYKTLHNLKFLPDPESESYRLITFPIENKNPKFFLQVIVPRTLLETQIENRFLVFQFGIPFLIILSMLIGYYIAGKALSPVNQIIEVTRRITAAALAERVPVPNANDEFKELAITLNQLLDRIEKSFQSQEKFIADASHQLLSPLTILKSELEFFLKKENKELEINDFINNQQSEIDNLSQIVQDMLLLARMDAGVSHFNLSPVFLEESLIESYSSLEKKADKKNIKIKFNIEENNLNQPKVIADSDLLKHLFHNIIDNAIKYSPANSTISITLDWKENTSLVQIKDEGPGIPEDQLQFIFERFSRVPQSSKIQGFGLGLAIAKKIANLHNATLKVHNLSTKGCEFQFEIKNI